MEVIKMSKKEKKNKLSNNKTQDNSNSTVELQKSHDNSLAHECGKENCSCTKHDNCNSSLTGGE